MKGGILGGKNNTYIVSDKKVRSTSEHAHQNSAPKKLTKRRTRSSPVGTNNLLSSGLKEKLLKRLDESLSEETQRQYEKHYKNNPPSISDSSHKHQETIKSIVQILEQFKWSLYFPQNFKSDSKHAFAPYILANKDNSGNRLFYCEDKENIQTLDGNHLNNFNCK